MRQLGSPTTFETVKVVGKFGGKGLSLFVPADKKGEWVLLPPTFKVTIDDGSAPYDLEIDCAVNAETKVVEIVAFKATKRKVQIQDNGLKSISLAAIRNEAIRRIGEIMTEGKDGKLHGSLFPPRKTQMSDDVLRRAVNRQNANSRDLNQAKQIANFARAQIEKGQKDWLEQTLKEFNISRATYYRNADFAKFNARQLKRKAKKK
jgi:hypothetical protein